MLRDPWCVVQLVIKAVNLDGGLLRDRPLLELVIPATCEIRVVGVWWYAKVEPGKGGHVDLELDGFDAGQQRLGASLAQADVADTALDLVPRRHKLETVRGPVGEGEVKVLDLCEPTIWQECIAGTIQTGHLGSPGKAGEAGATLCQDVVQVGGPDSGVGLEGQMPAEVGQRLHACIVQQVCSLYGPEGVWHIQGLRDWHLASGVALDKGRKEACRLVIWRTVVLQVASLGSDIQLVPVDSFVQSIYARLVDGPTCLGKTAQRAELMLGGEDLGNLVDDVRLHRGLSLCFALAHGFASSAHCAEVSASTMGGSRCARRSVRVAQKHRPPAELNN